ncbi:hypothetical protein ACFL27_01960 [candidate division CSSED10-310 bacterium]|uniref:Uncharacterized protein n=1 Tax=candidate division CSSED10-310 bacterium TaxID=2855610 RepID=A0ABV6YRW9_UNCC1
MSDALSRRKTNAIIIELWYFNDLTALDRRPGPETGVICCTKGHTKEWDCEKIVTVSLVSRLQDPGKLCLLPEKITVVEDNSPKKDSLLSGSIRLRLSRKAAMVGHEDGMPHNAA